MATERWERTAVHATVHIREKTARKVSNKSKTLYFSLSE